jgi:hypothetical protein
VHTLFGSFPPELVQQDEAEDTRLFNMQYIPMDAIWTASPGRYVPSTDELGWVKINTPRAGKTTKGNARATWEEEQVEREEDPFRSNIPPPEVDSGSGSSALAWCDL